MVEDVVPVGSDALGSSDGSEEAADVVAADVVVEVVLVLLVVVVVSAAGAGGRSCVSVALPDVSGGGVSVGAGAMAVVTASAADVGVLEPLSSLLAEEQAAASKAVARAIAMQNFAFTVYIICSATPLGDKHGRSVRLDKIARGQKIGNVASILFLCKILPNGRMNMRLSLPRRLR